MSEHTAHGWWTRAIRPSPRKRLTAAAIALALVAVTVGVWLSPSVDGVVPTRASAEEMRLQAENEKLRYSLEAREQEVLDLERSQRKAASERSAAAERGKAKAAEEKAAADAAAQQKAAEEQAAAKAASSAKAASEKKAAAERGKARDRAEQAEAALARARAAAATPSSSGPAPEVKPTAPPLAALRQPTARQFGLYTPQAPFSWAEQDAVAAQIGTQPNIVGYFQGWDGNFRADAVSRSWAKGAMPMLTWESRNLATANDVVEEPEWSLKEITNGRYDAYLRQYAADVTALGLPVAIRLDHEMNASWYPWNEQGSGGASVNGNSPGDYVAMWRHVHDIFEASGANQYVLWVWAPNIVNNLPAANQSLAYTKSLYPGDEYVDWVGLSGYYRPPYRDGQTPTFAWTFDKSLDQLRAITHKPIFLAEIGASESGGQKAAWVTDLFDALAKPENADVVGFAWFNHAVTTISQGERVTNDWRVESRADSLAAFVEGLHDPAAGFALPGGAS
ncbi:glycoside hydrolase family 26 protein [Cellulomonas algicola]|uniref:glycoside hydrolase family 26 protein n=2 Tax=Cellulomonas algicola TaxID=2071633 RepID=UPI001C3F69A9|nr:glycosyl hydrolase [Cellulomonas algicola]